MVHQNTFEFNTTLKYLTSKPTQLLEQSNLNKITKNYITNLIIIETHTPSHIESTQILSHNHNYIFENINLTKSIKTTIVQNHPLTNQIKKIDINQ